MRELRSGAPVDVTPLRDDPTLGTDPSRNDKFRYDPNSQERCPYAAHTRKTNPRDDLPSTEAKRILRRGIQFGPEVTADEAASNTTALQRGLLFVCYQSNIFNGFRFIQTRRFLPRNNPLDDHALTIAQSGRIMSTFHLTRKMCQRLDLTPSLVKPMT